MKHLHHTVILSFFLAGSALATQNNGPLTAAQMNELPPEVQARVHVMMGAEKVKTRTKPDGTKADVYQEPTIPNAYKGALEGAYAERQEKYLTEKDKGIDASAKAGTPLAEAAIVAPRGHYAESSPDDKKYNVKNYVIHTLNDLKAASFQREEPKKKVAVIELNIPNGYDFMTHFEAYVPYLKNVDGVTLSFSDAQENDPNFPTLMRAFAGKVDPYLTVSILKEVSFSLHIALRKETFKKFKDAPQWSRGKDAIIKGMGFRGGDVPTYGYGGGIEISER
jgi:hypothetical protein